jgi:hypothetical protein
MGTHVLKWGWKERKGGWMWMVISTYPYPSNGRLVDTTRKMEGAGNMCVFLNAA